MEKAIVEVNYSGKNYGAHLPELPGCVTTGSSLDEIVRNVNEIVPFHLDGMREDGDAVPAPFDGEYEFEYRLTTEALLHAYSGVFTKAALSRITGINERQLWHYEAGIRKPRPAQRKRIEDGLHKLAAQLLSITL